MAKITIKELESLTANDAGRILREDGNLAGRISVRKDGVSVSFFYRYRWGDQNKEYACGTWPRKSLTDIRKARNQARALIDEQILYMRDIWNTPRIGFQHAFPCEPSDEP